MFKKSLFYIILFVLIFLGIFFSFSLKNEFIKYVDNKKIVKIDINNVQKENLILEGYVVSVTKDESIIFETSSSDILLLEKNYPSLKLKKYIENMYQEYYYNIDDLSYFVKVYRPFYFQEFELNYLHNLQLSMYYITFILISLLILVSFFKKHLYNKDKRYVGLLKKIDGLNNVIDLQKQLSLDITHELRTPLTAISLSLENVIEGVWNFDLERTKNLYSQVQRLNRLIENINLLDFSKDLKINFEKVDISLIINDVLILYHQKFILKNFTVNFIKKEIFVFGNKDLLTQVFINLIDNALKYSLDFKSLDISIIDENEVIISIKDQGFGIKKEDINEIFKRFYSTSSNSSGVGLTISHRIIKTHNGNILVFSKENEGSEFIITLPPYNLHKQLL